MTSPEALRLAALGQHFTPRPAAAALVDLILQRRPDWATLQRPLRVLDPACGAGDLLLGAADALHARGLRADLLGVELDPAVAAVAAPRLAAAGGALRCADALTLTRADLPEPPDLIVLNPPYIGEKGHQALFAEVAARGAPWSARTRPRMDYLYYFLHLGLDLLAEDGELLALTTAYWPAATSARALRADLLQRAQLRAWLRLEGRPLFSGALGQHNLASYFAGPAAPAAPPALLRAAWDGARLDLTHRAPAAPLTTDVPWTLDASPDGLAWVREVQATWLRLDDVALDRQGIVSGCDRPGGAPGFVWRRDELEDAGWWDAPWRDDWLRPLLRGSHTAPLHALDVARDDAPWMLHLHDNTPPPQTILDALQPHRATLEARREVALGRMPWFRLHWPRRREELLAPKLVTARRAAQLAFSLDLSQSLVSSDCTFLIPSVDLSPESWMLLWLALHLPEVQRYMALTGKRKGALLELYSEPLRQLRLPLRLDEGRLHPLGDPEPLRRLAEQVRRDDASWQAITRAGWAGAFDKALGT